MWRFVNRNPLPLDVATQKAERLVRRYAANGPYALDADPVVVSNIVRGLARNWSEHGLPYCPCKELSGDRDADRRLVCPCREHHAEIAAQGSCCCGLFWRSD